MELRLHLVAIFSSPIITTVLKKWGNNYMYNYIIIIFAPCIFYTNFFFITVFREINFECSIPEIINLDSHHLTGLNFL